MAYRASFRCNKILNLRTICPNEVCITGVWGKLHSEEFCNLYFPPNAVRVIKSTENEMGGTCSTHGRNKDVIRMEMMICIGLYFV